MHRVQVALVLWLVSAPAVPKGWRVVKDAKARCQLAVPGEWTGETSLASAPGRKGTAVVHGLPKGRTWDQAISFAKTAMKPVTMIEDGPARVWYAYDSGSEGTTSWYVVVPGDPICTAQVEFREAGLEVTARAIVGSLEAVR
ncbi:MAG TPA: hypothetical protein VN083_02860 [Vicinamibacteria bacterium]|nr:hypothetical protein [Vicinamibacteria bacterium]